MRTLYLMRHAKSRWDEYVSDTERGLKKRGKREARQLGRGLAEQEPPPDLVMSSPARRARKTATRVAKLLAAYYNHPAADVHALEQVLLRVSDLAVTRLI